MRKRKPKRPVPKTLTLDEIERGVIERALLMTKGCQAKAARRLGISARTISRKLAQWAVLDQLAQKKANVDKMSSGENNNP
jgi:DNA-binding NtrC family response regulator